MSDPSLPGREAWAWKPDTQVRGRFTVICGTLNKSCNFPEVCFVLLFVFFLIGKIEIIIVKVPGLEVAERIK